MSLCLTPDELYDLTGYVQPSKQVEMLRKARIRHIVGPDGHPRVARVWLSEASSPANTRRAEPRLEALHGKKKSA